MLERDGYPAGVPCWVDTIQPDPEAATDFYRGLFGWQFVERTLTGTPQRYFVAQLRDRDVAGVGSQPDGAPTAPAWNTYVWVDSADQVSATAKDHGGRVLMEPVDVGDAGRMAVLSDPSGATFCVWQAKGHKGAQLVNEPGTWNFSGLDTWDEEGAKAFYGAVFGWKATSLGPDGSGGSFWRVDGYGDFLERSDPDIRQRNTDVHAPEGFEDAVAWLAPMTADAWPEGTPPRWGVTFSGADADATADRASELGAEVLVAPVDAPGVRMAVLRDPQGAVFTASQFTPPT